VKSAFLNGVI
jgi:hypothetical protein